MEIKEINKTGFIGSIIYYLSEYMVDNISKKELKNNINSLFEKDIKYTKEQYIILYFPHDTPKPKLVKLFNTILRR